MYLINISSKAPVLAGPALPRMASTRREVVWRTKLCFFYAVEGFSKAVLGPGMCTKNQHFDLEPFTALRLSLTSKGSVPVLTTL